MTCQSHPPPHDRSNYIWRRVYVMKLLIMSLLTPITSSFFGPNIPLSTLFYLLPLISETVSHTHTHITTCKIILL
jgi:hypothetical protein